MGDVLLVGHGEEPAALRADVPLDPLTPRASGAPPRAGAAPRASGAPPRARGSEAGAGGSGPESWSPVPGGKGGPIEAESPAAAAERERARFGPGIYLHYPFCRRRCGYCDFYVVLAEEDARAAFVESLLREIDLVADAEAWAVPFRTIFFGGGTPSLLSGTQMERILGRLRRRFALASEVEITAECNPESLVPSTMRSFLAAGVNRFSLGVQSMEDDELALLDRLHGSQDVVRRVEELRSAGAVQLNLDLIYGLPNASHAKWERSLARAFALRPDHLSAYLLTLEPHVPLARKVAADAAALALPEDDDAARQYEILRACTAQAGFAQYEISNFARPGAESRHNQNYWSRGDYLGLGPSAHSHGGGRRWFNSRSLTTYARALEEGRLPREGEETIPPQAVAEEWIFLGLRRMEGISWSVLESAGIPLAPVRRTAEALAAQGFVECTSDRLRLLPRAYFVSNSVFSELVAAL